MKTASFFTYHGPGRISIARSAPRGMTGFVIHRALAPTWTMLRMGKAEYIEHFNTLLARLNPEREWATLHRLAGAHEPVLLCWERPPFSETNWCHRRIVAEWFERNLGLEVLEITP